MQANIGFQLRTLQRLLFLIAIAFLYFGVGCGGDKFGPHIVSLTISPNPLEVAMGTVGQLKATGKFADGNQRDLTNSVLWQPDGANIASISATGAVTPITTGQGGVRAVYGSVVASADLIVDAAALVQIEVAPPSTSMSLGSSVQFKATGHYADNATADITSSVSWQSSAPSVAAITSAGSATSKSVGRTNVTATLNAVQGSAKLSITPATLVAIAVSGSSSLHVGEQAQMLATGTFSDNSSQDITKAVTWGSSAPGVISIGAGGTAKATAVGAANVTATVGSLVGSKAMSVTAAALKKIDVSSNTSTLPLGQQTQMHATGTFTDNSSQDITSSVSWSSSAPAIVSLTSTGIAQANAVGTANVSASQGTIVGTKLMTATTAMLTGIDISSPKDELPVGTSVQLTATGHYSDNSQQDITGTVQWSSSDTQVLSVGSSGEVTANAVGAATVIASLNSLSASHPMLVLPAQLSSVTVSPQSSVVPMGQQQQYMLTASYSDGSKQDVTGSATWSSDNPQVATIGSGGTAVTLQVGKAGIQGSYQGQQDTAGLTVQPLLTVNYFNIFDDLDGTLRVAQSSDAAPKLCAMLYVFDADQQMSECCGCPTSHSGLLTLSYQNDLLSNPLTGRKSTAGTVIVVAADQASNTDCDAGAITPLGSMASWSTTLEPVGDNQYMVQETPAASSPLSDVQASSFQAQCSFIKALGSGQGVCSCGGGEGKATKSRRQK